MPASLLKLVIIITYIYIHNILHHHVIHHHVRTEQDPTQLRQRVYYTLQSSGPPSVERINQGEIYKARMKTTLVQTLVALLAVCEGAMNLHL